ncbi:helix-turn-helix transcriptional regulator [Candidatus Parcubacteria bacterium]|nr:helix-turn-helix transcriptional regulator [Candidatus Parcubacteria bacterium]
MALNKTLGDELKNCRESKKFTLREIEEITGISNAYLSQLENNKIKKPSANILYKLSNVYKIDFDFLLETAGIIEKKERKKGPKSLSGFALYSEDLTDNEEEELVNYLKFLRFSEKKNDKK